MTKTLLVTGAAHGSGRAIAERFASEGHNVAVTSRDEERACLAATEIAARYGVRTGGYALLQRDPDSVERLYKQLDRDLLLPDVLVLCAADLGIGMDPFTVTAEQWASVVATNLTGGFLMARAAARYMASKGEGTIVFIGSNTSRRAIRGRSAYIASKGGLVSLTKALAVEFGPLGIRVNCLVPGSIKSARWEAQTEEWREVRRKRAPVGDVATNEDIAAGAWYLGSHESRNVTGIELVIDGGVDAQLIPGL